MLFQSLLIMLAAILIISEALVIMFRMPPPLPDPFLELFQCFGSRYGTPEKTHLDARDAGGEGMPVEHLHQPAAKARALSHK